MIGQSGGLADRAGGECFSDMEDIFCEVLGYAWFDVLYRVRLRVVEVGVADYRQVEPGDGEVLVELAEIGAVTETLSEVWFGYLRS